MSVLRRSVIGRSVIACGLATALLAAASGACWAGPPFENPATEYLQRTDTITLSAGNAKNANAVVHIIDPWPRHVTNRRIPANGERMAHTMEHYKSGAGATANQPGASGGISGGTPTGSATPSQYTGGTPGQ
jgi:hypothetical protein